MKLIIFFFLISLVLVASPCFANEENASEDAVKKLSDALRKRPEHFNKDNGPNSQIIQYHSTIYQKIHDNWKLPENEKFDNKLEAVIVIRIQRTGHIEQIYFEKKSENNEFNNLAVQSILNTSPLPQFPPELKRDILEVGLRFKPGEFK